MVLNPDQIQHHLQKIISAQSFPFGNRWFGQNVPKILNKAFLVKPETLGNGSCQFFYRKICERIFGYEVKFEDMDFLLRGVQMGGGKFGL
jgi:hypothetical protein